MFAGMFAGIAARLAGSVLMQSPIGALLKGFWRLLGKIPWQVTAGIFLALALWLGFRWHGHEVHKTYQKGYNQARAEDRAALDELRRKLKTAGDNMATISHDQRSKNDAARHNIDAAAGSLSLQGPGAARCRREPAAAVPASAGRSQPPARPAGPAPDSVPSEDGADPLAAVPWGWLVGTGKQCDLDRAENIAWRNAYVGWVAEWEKLRARP